MKQRQSSQVRSRASRHPLRAFPLRQARLHLTAVRPSRLALSRYCNAKWLATLVLATMSSSCALFPLDPVQNSEPDGGRSGSSTDARGADGSAGTASDVDPDGLGDGAAVTDEGDDTPSADNSSGSDTSDGGRRDETTPGDDSSAASDSDGASGGTNATPDAGGIDSEFTADGSNPLDDALRDGGQGTDPDQSNPTDQTDDETSSSSETEAPHDSGTGSEPIEDSGIEWFVDAASGSASPTGKSWGEAFTHPQQAMDVAGPGDTIWVRVGEYHPPSAGAAVLSMTPGVKVVGGVAADPPTAQAETLFVGDFEQNDAPDSIASLQDNSEHVVVGADSVSLSSIVIRNGYARESAGGGGLFLSNATNVQLQAVSFKENEAEGDGGALYMDEESSASLKDCEFRSNRAQNGGALATKGAALTLADTDFWSNFASADGGAIYDTGGPFAFEIEDRALFQINEAAGRGGAIYSTRPKIEFAYPAFYYNTAATGGALYLAGVNAEIGWLKTRSNTATDPTAGAGGVIFATASHISGNRFEALDDSATASGGVIHLEGGSIELYDQWFVSNGQAVNGGAFYFDSVDVSLAQGRAIKCQGSFGGAIFSKGSTLELDLVDFDKNVATSAGAAIYSQGDSLTVNNAVFAGNLAGDGGAIDFRANQAVEGELVLTNSVLWRNEAVDDGGGLHLVAGSARLEDVLLVQNAADRGAAIAASGSSTLLLLASDSRDNAATTSGGALFVSDAAEVTVLNAAFVDNGAPDGSVLLGTTSEAVFMGNVTLLNNSGADPNAWLDSSEEVRLVNSALWNDAESNIDVSGPVSLEYSCAPAGPTATNSVTLSASPLEEPGPDAKTFLDPSSGVGCKDIGSEALASDADVGFDAVGLPDWFTQTTSANLQVDSNGGGANDLDAGRHYPPTTVIVTSLSIDSTQLQWTAPNATRCKVWNDQSEPARLDASSATESTIATPTNAQFSHEQSGGTTLALLCGGEQGGWAFAHAVVP